MGQSQLANPYDTTLIDEVHLSRAPLVRVLTQVRHAPLTALAGDEGAKMAMEVANALAGPFPISRKIKSAELILSEQGVEEREGGATVWKLASKDEAWQVSYSREFIALETTAYAGRTDFCKRIADIVDIYSNLVNPPAATRVGVRYTNRIDDDQIIGILSELVRPEILGPVSTQLPPGAILSHALGQAQFASNNDGLILNWGLLPPSGTIDAAISPSKNTSWFLDIDAFSTTRLEMTATEIESGTRRLAEQAYRCFRWAVTEDFLRLFGEQ